MRILHLTNHVQKIGNGIVNVAVDLACLQAKLGHEVAVASAGGDFEALLVSNNITHFHLEQSRTPIKLLKAVWRYIDIVREFQPDIVHAHMMTGVVLASVLRNSSYRLVSTVHNEFQRSAIFMGLADRVIAVSHAVAKSMEKRGIPQSKLSVVSNGTLGSPRHRNIKEYRPLPLHRPAITTVAGMYQRKGIGEVIDGFIEIADKFPNAHLYLVGDGPDRKMFEEKVKRTKFTNRIHFEGFQTEPQKYMLASDIFVLASYHESFGLVLTEAREAGCAIVASDVDGIPETLDNRQAGILVPPKDSHAIAEAITTLLSDPSELNKWKLVARKNLERFSAARVNEETIAIYQELLKECKLVSLV